MKRNEDREQELDEIYADVDDRLEMDYAIDWDDISDDYFHITVVPKKETASLEKMTQRQIIEYTKNRGQYIRERNSMLQLINNRAFDTGVEWKLFIAKHSTSVIKYSKNRVPNKQLYHDFNWIFRSFVNDIKSSEHMIASEYYSKEVKSICRQAINGAYGLATILIGQINSSKNMKRDTKTMLLSGSAKFFIEDKTEE